MIEIKELSFGFPQKDLFKNISFDISAGEHIAFIGASGNGKSTLVEMIMDLDKYMYDGKIDIDANCRIGHVSQFYKKPVSSTETVFEFLCGPFHKLQNEINILCTQMETTENIESVLEEYQNALDAFDAIGGHDYETDILKKLNLADLGKIKDLNIEKISGGEFKLVQVIKEMALNPHLLIMDEPDVFLDFENLNALKALINAHKGILLVITHNRYLLNHCFNKIIHLENMELQVFEGNFIEYKFELLKSKIEQQELSIKDDMEIAKNEALIDNLRRIATHNTDASRGKALKARMKVQERLEARRIKAPFIEINQPNIKFEIANPEFNETVLSVNDLSISFEHDLIKNATFEIGPAEKVALIGANGAGKTTLFKEILKNQNESIKIADGIKICHLSQNLSDSIYENLTVVDTFFELGMPSSDAIRMHLAKFGFKSEILKQKISSISGGEKNLMQLAIIAVQKSNLLLLDEPTSHLDTYAQIAIEKAIEDYKGSVLMISHDYHMISSCMDYVLIIENHSLRKMSIRKFRKMIYENHFTITYLELEQKKKKLEVQIEEALDQSDFETAQKYILALEEVIKGMIS